jgi:hypothetical protein
MRVPEELEIGLMFWGEKQPRKTIEAVKALGMNCGHLGFAGHVPLDNVASQWHSAAEEQDFAISSIGAAFEGESYADKPTVLRTVGFIPKLRAPRARFGQSKSSIPGPPWASRSLRAISALFRKTIQTRPLSQCVTWFGACAITQLGTA